MLLFGARLCAHICVCRCVFSCCLSAWWNEDVLPSLCFSRLEKGGREERWHGMCHQCLPHWSYCQAAALIIGTTNRDNVALQMQGCMAICGCVIDTSLSLSLLHNNAETMCHPLFTARLRDKYIFRQLSPDWMSRPHWQAAKSMQVCGILPPHLKHSWECSP